MAISPNCHLIAVTGGKGGVGKSVFAANLATSLMLEMRAKTLLIDLDNQSCGDQNVIVGLRPLKTVGEVANFKGTINQQTLASVATAHPSGLHYIGAVQSPDQSLSGNANLFRKQLFSLSQFYKYIVVDLGNEITELQLGMIEDCSSLLMVTTPEVLVINQTRKKLQELMSATVPSELIQIVLNKVSPNTLNPQSIQQSLKRPIIGAIPQDDATAYGALQRSAPFVLAAPNAPITASVKEVVRRLTGGILQKLKVTSRPQLKSQKTTNPALTSQRSASSSGENDLDPITLLKIQVHGALIKEMDLKKDLTKIEGDPGKEKELKNKTLGVVSQLVDRMGQGIGREDRAQVIKQVLDEALGLGPLEDLLSDPSVTEIMVNGAKKIYVEKSGKLTVSTVTFTSNQQLKNVIDRIIMPLGRRIDEKTPYVDARLKDGSRVNAIIEPLSIDGPALTIRKFPDERITINDMVSRFKSMTTPMAEFLRICVEQGLNVIISGGTGTGKTTMLNVLSGFIPANERIITVEDAAELQLKQDHVVRLETKPANIEGAGAITIRDLVANSLRMRPDRIIVGECRDGAALDMLSAMNTGHDGSMTTVHANNPKEAVARLETLCLMAGMDLPVSAIRDQIAGAVDLILQITRFSDGSRRISSITEVVGVMGEIVTMQEIFRFKETGFDKNRKVIGEFRAEGRIPTFIEKFERRGIKIPRNLFTSNSGSLAQSNSTPTPITKKRDTSTEATKSNIKSTTGSDKGTGTRGR